MAFDREDYTCNDNIIPKSLLGLPVSPFVTESTGGFLIPGAYDIRVPIWDNWVGRFLMRHTRFYRVRTVDLVGELIKQIPTVHTPGVGRRR